MILKNPRNLLWLLPLFLFVTSPLWKPSVASFLKPRGKYEAPQINKNEHQSQNFIMDALTITMSNRGRVEWVINAEKAFTTESDNEIALFEVDALHTDTNKDKTRITSSRGKYDIEGRHLVLIDDVVIRKPASQQEMYTDLLHYYDARKMAISPEKVTIKGPDYSINAGRLDYDLATEGYDFSNRVIVEF